MSIIQKILSGFIVMGLAGSIYFTQPVVAETVRGLDDLDIISREERHADESLRYLNHQAYARYLQDLDAYEKRLQGIGVDRGGKFAARKARAEINNKRRSFLIENYPADIAVDSEHDEHEGHDLLWTEEFAHDKTKIIIHHTAGSQVYDTPEASMKGVQDIYLYHAHSRGRGDIGYNFLIDPFGNIYEGRAGGQSVVAAHTDWNNTSTIGIALMGNFEIAEPTPAMRRSLTKLVTALAIEYNIDPYEQKPYFTALEKEPRLDVHQHDSIVGHRDAKSTACPGQHVYDKLPELKRTVAAYLSQFRVQGVTDFDDAKFIKATPVYADSATTTVRIATPTSASEVTCSLIDPMLTVVDCISAPQGVEITLKRLGYLASGVKTVVLTVGDRSYLAEVSVVRQDDIEELLIRKKTQHAQQYGIVNPRAQEKMLNKVRPVDIPGLATRNVDVLLYDLTASYSNRDMRCESGCTVTLDDQTISGAQIVNVVEDAANDRLNVFIDLKKYTSTNVHIKNTGLVVFTNYERAVGGYPMNMFRGDIAITLGRYNHLEQGWIDAYVVINSVTLDDYLAGIGETSEKQHDEKLKLMALLVKNYALFYIEGKNPHNSLPTDGSYNAVDDPRIFQKYLGAGRESYGQRRLQAVRATANEIITYDGYLPILPYFHCSAGFTRSGQEYFGWTDTPWLRSKIDVVACSSGNFEGHGVGLSGDGAERLAQRGVGYKDILRRYYDGIEISAY